jgi:hypothetical protein
LPAGDVPAALFAFNAGVEAGQILCVALILVALAAWRKLPVRPYSPILSRAMGYAIGSTGAFWFCERFIFLLPMTR